MYLACMWYTQEKKEKSYQIRVVKTLLSACALILQQTWHAKSNLKDLDDATVQHYIN